MKKLGLPIFLLWSAFALWGQVPSQFSGMLTSSTDYTTNTSVFVAPVTASATAFAVTSNAVTVTVPNSFTVGQRVLLTGFPTSTYLNGYVLTLTSASSTAITGSGSGFVHANVTTTTESGTIQLYDRVPDFGGCATDATFGTAACRLALPTDCPALSHANISGNCASNLFGWNNEYSKVTPFSSDMVYRFVIDPVGYFYLYHNSGTYNAPVWSFVKRIDSAATGYGANRDHDTGAGIYSDNSNLVWSNTPGTHVLYYTGSSPANPYRTMLKKFDPDAADASAITIVHDFSSTIALYSGGVGIDDEREGNASEDDRYWAFTVNGTGGNNDSKAALTYDMTANSVLASASFGAGGLCGASACPTTANWIGMSPSGTYVMINWNPPNCHNNTWVRGCGTEEYSRSLSFLGVLDSGAGHADGTYDVNGDEVYVSIPDGNYGGHYPYFQISMTKMSAVATTITGAAPTGQRVVQLPCDWNFTAGCPTGGSFRNRSFTISGRATRGSGKGYALLSMYDLNNDYRGASGWGSTENIAIKLDWTNAYPTPNDGNSATLATFYRLGRSHGIGGNPSVYTAQPNGVPNKDFTAFAYTSTADVNVQPDAFGTPAAPFVELSTYLGGTVTGNTNMELDTDWLQPGNAGNDTAHPCSTSGTFTFTPGSPGTWYIQGACQYNNGYWYRTLGTSFNAINNIEYALDVMLPTSGDVTASQAIEFETQQNVGSNIYNCGVQDDVIGTHLWRVFDYTSATWTPTTIPATTFTPGSYHTFDIVCHRNPGNTITFVSLTIDGTLHPIGITKSAFALVDHDYINAGFQGDSNGLNPPTPYTIKTKNMNTTLSTTADSFTITPSSSTISVGGTQGYTCTTNLGAACPSPTYTSSASTSIVTIAGSVATGRGVGTATIVGHVSGLPDVSVALNVIAPAPPPSNGPSGNGTISGNTVIVSGNVNWLKVAPEGGKWVVPPAKVQPTANMMMRFGSAPSWLYLPIPAAGSIVMASMMYFGGRPSTKINELDVQVTSVASQPQ